jgi:hypothetical protein
VNPYFFKHATRAARLAVDGPVPAEATAVEVAELEAVAVLEPAELPEPEPEPLELLPHAAMTQPAATTASASSARRIAISIVFKVLVLSNFPMLSLSRRCRSRTRS